MNISMVDQNTLNKIANFKVFSIIEEKSEVTLVEDFVDTPKTLVLSKKDFWKLYRRVV